MKKKAGKIVIIILSTVVVLTFLAFFFRVKKVRVEGNEYFSANQTAAMFQTNIFEKNIISFWILHHCNLIHQPEFVREYQVSYPSPNEIHIKLYEKKMLAGIAYSNQYIYFDKDGMVMKSTGEPIEGIPLFETKTVTTFTLYSHVQMQDEKLLDQIMNLSKLFLHYEIPWDKVQFNDSREAFLYSGDIKVDLGCQDNYDEEISALSHGILTTAKEKKLKGEIDMTDYHVKDDVILKQQK